MEFTCSRELQAKLEEWRPMGLRYNWVNGSARGFSYELLELYLAPAAPAEPTREDGLPIVRINQNRASILSPTFYFLDDVSRIPCGF